MTDFPPPPPKLGFLAWFRIALVLFLAVAVAVLALFFAGIFLAIGLVGAAIFSIWATFKVRRSTIQGHYASYEVRKSGGRQIIRGDFLEVEDSQDLNSSAKRKKKGGKAKPGSGKTKGKSGGFF